MRYAASTSNTTLYIAPATAATATAAASAADAAATASGSESQFLVMMYIHGRKDTNGGGGHRNTYVGEGGVDSA